MYTIPTTNYLFTITKSHLLNLIDDNYFMFKHNNKLSNCAFENLSKIFIFLFRVFFTQIIRYQIFLIRLNSAYLQIICKYKFVRYGHIERLKLYMTPLRSPKCRIFKQQYLEIGRFSISVWSLEPKVLKLDGSSLGNMPSIYIPNG